jgi:hypothetical protein
LSSWLPEQSARLEFKGQLNDGNLQLQVEVSPFANQIGTAGHIQLEGLTLMPFARLLEPHLKSLKGSLDADLKFATGQTAEEKLKIDADGKLKGSSLSTIIKNANIQIQQGNIDWQGKIDYTQTAAAADLKLNGALSVQNANVTGPDINLSEKSLNWRGVFTFSTSSADVAQNISSEGELSTGPLTLHLPQQKINIEHAGLEWQGKFAYAQDKAKKSINADGQIQLNAAKLKSPELNFAEDKLSWKGEFQLFAPAESAGQRIMTDGTLDSSHMQVDLLDRKLKIEHKGLSWQGRLDTGEANNDASLTTKADITLKDIKILHSETSRHLLNSQQVNLQAVQSEGLDKISVAGIALTGLTLLADPKTTQASAADSSPLHVQEIKVNNVQLLKRHNLAIDAFQLNTVKAFVHRNPEGKLPAIESWLAIQTDMLAAGRTDQAISDTAAKEKSDAFNFRLGRVEISEGSEIHIKDESVGPAFIMDLSILQAQVTELDSNRPEQPASVKLLLSDKEDARLSLDGTMIPFAEKISLDWIGKIEALELPSLSPYVIRSTGYRFTSGELEADVPLKIVRGELKGEIDLTLLNPKIKRADAEMSGERQQGKIQLNMTLDSALRLLRDKQNDVKIKIPVKGNIRDPQFSVADAINKVLARTLQTAAFSYLKYMLGPYGIGISVAQLAYEQTIKIRLNPIQFAPGSDELDEAAIDYLQRVAAIMKEYTEVQVVLCGVATESDRKAISGAPAVKKKEPSTSQADTTDSALLALAGQRSDQIQNQLVNVHSITAKRIISCEPKIEKSKNAKPRVDLEL